MEQPHVEAPSSGPRGVLRRQVVPPAIGAEIQQQVPARVNAGGPPIDWVSTKFRVVFSPGGVNRYAA